MKSILYAIALSVTLSGCQVLTDRDNKLAASTILGAGTGILMASQIYGSGSGGAIAMVFMGAAGATGGYYLAQELLPPEKEAFGEAAYKSLESSKIGETVSWRNEHTGNSGSFTPTQDFTDKQGRRCRTFKSSITVHSETANSEASACRITDSAWRAV
jgi:surface antigen